MKKLLSVALIVVLAASMLVGCGNSGKDWDYIKGNKKLVIGITYFAPMNYEDENGELIGFETEFAKAVCQKLGLMILIQES